MHGTMSLKFTKKAHNFILDMAENAHFSRSKGNIIYNTGIKTFKYFIISWPPPSSSLLNTNFTNIVIHTKEFLTWCCYEHAYKSKQVSPSIVSPYNENFGPKELIVHNTRGSRIKILHLKLEILTGFCGLSQIRKQISVEHNVCLEEEELDVSAPTPSSAGCRITYLQETIYNNTSNIINILNSKYTLCQLVDFCILNTAVYVTLPYSLLIQAHTRTVAIISLSIGNINQ